jgi:glutaredoxin
MAVKLHRCKNVWFKVAGHPCWRVQKALDEQGVEYEIVPGPWPGRRNRTAVKALTGQTSYPVIEFENGSSYREESKDMAQTIRSGRLFDKQEQPTA